MGNNKGFFGDGLNLGTENNAQHFLKTNNILIVKTIFFVLCGAILSSSMSIVHRLEHSL